jgi:hypothetical protein
MLETEVRHISILGTWAAIVGIGIYGNAATRSKDSLDLDVLGVHETNQVLHYRVDTILVEIAMIAETEKIEFEALAFDQTLVRQVIDDYLSKIGLTRDWTQRGEFWTLEMNPVVILRVFVLETLEHFWCIILPVLCLLA